MLFADKSLKDVGVIKADVDDPNSLSEMAKKGKIVLNCVGPYRCLTTIDIPLLLVTSPTYYFVFLDFMEKL